ncbi:hypothetical protein [Geminocystis sp.]|uniref:hypothetical protein n=1 Tax=Geminocystis sp. TaxID=2664100 RepID=UPI0035948CD8
MRKLIKKTLIGDSTLSWYYDGYKLELTTNIDNDEINKKILREALSFGSYPIGNFIRPPEEGISAYKLVSKIKKAEEITSKELKNNAEIITLFEDYPPLLPKDQKKIDEIVKHRQKMMLKGIFLD